MTKPQAVPFHLSVDAFRAGRDTPSRYLERCIATIADREPDVGAFVTLNIETARAASAQSRQRWRDGKPLSLIDGMPVGVKDIIETYDMPTQMGSDLYQGWRSERDAASVHALREAGAVVVGKTVTTEFAATFPRGTRNPWDLSRTPGGSSSGSAAAAACGMLPVALGTQGLGSILRPASYCGCVGFKPTFGAVNRGGSFDTVSQSAHGALAACIEDAWLMLRAIVDRIGGDPGFAGLAGPEEPPAPARPKRLALLRTAGWTDADPNAKRALAAMADRLRAEGVELSMGDNHAGVAKVESALIRAMPASLKLNAWDMRWPLNACRDRDASKVSAVMLSRLAEAEAMSHAEYRTLVAERQNARAVWTELASDFDGAVSLAADSVAPVGLQSSGNAVFAVPSSYLGTPVLSLPLISVGGLPVGFQVMGFAERDAEIVGIARWLMQHLPPVSA
jgi:Asp-tRNA(Asn)/Glu-tRNA(Gln) amidotransferase A subunit family amidase